MGKDYYGFYTSNFLNKKCFPAFRLFLYKITLIIVFNLVDKRAEYLSRFKRVIIFGNILTPISTARVRQPYREYERIRSESGQSEGVVFFREVPNLPPAHNIKKNKHGRSML